VPENEQENPDSGLACLALLLRFHRLAADSEQIRHLSGGVAVGTRDARLCGRTGPESAPDQQQLGAQRGGSSGAPARLCRHIALKQTGISTEDGFTPLEPGMAVTVEIKTGRRRVIEFLLSPLLRYRQEAWRER
jgi:hemolysin D